jgi:hypothetical protein
MKRAALLAYVGSFLLVAVSGPDTRGSFPGFYCAYVTLLVGFRSVAAEGATLRAITYLMSGSVNIAFLAAMTIHLRTGKGWAFRILRAITLAMIPFSWYLLFQMHLYPREGHIVWIGGMLVALFARQPPVETPEFNRIIQR